jgi:hypothetical protein
MVRRQVQETRGGRRVRIHGSGPDGVVLGGNDSGGGFARVRGKPSAHENGWPADFCWWARAGVDDPNDGSDFMASQEIPNFFR